MSGAGHPAALVLGTTRTRVCPRSLQHGLSHRTNVTELHKYGRSDTSPPVKHVTNDHFWEAGL
jgi:hypothetical protein